VATEDTPLAVNGRDDTSSDTSRRPGKLNEREATRPGKVPREPSVNAIQASRRPRRGRNPTGQAVSAADAAPGVLATPSLPAVSPIQRTDSDPWTVPQSVRDTH
jgi:hypothetical protein